VQLFISYARPDQLKAESLAVKLRQAGIGVWLDSDLGDGQHWWDWILSELRSCDAVLATVSRASIESKACRAEREYAAKLGKPILPIIFERIAAGILPADIAQIQAVDYAQPDEAAAYGLMSAIYALTIGGNLPNPLPVPPEVP
jgi:hypothetical protein